MKTVGDCKRHKMIKKQFKPQLTPE